MNAEESSRLSFLGLNHQISGQFVLQEEVKDPFDGDGFNQRRRSSKKNKSPYNQNEVSRSNPVFHIDNMSAIEGADSHQGQWIIVPKRNDEKRNP